MSLSQILLSRLGALVSGAAFNAMSLPGPLMVRIVAAQTMAASPSAPLADTAKMPPGWWSMKSSLCAILGQLWDAVAAGFTVLQLGLIVDLICA